MRNNDIEYNNINFNQHFIMLIYGNILYIDNNILVYTNVINEDNDHLYNLINESSLTLLSTQRMLLETEYQANITIFFNMQTIKKPYIPLKIKKLMSKYIKSNDVDDILYLQQFIKEEKNEECEIFL